MRWYRVFLVLAGAFAAGIWTWQLSPPQPRLTLIQPEDFQSYFLSPNGRRIVLYEQSQYLNDSFSTPHPTTITLWDAVTGQFVAELYQGASGADCHTFSHDSSLLGICFDSRTELPVARVWELQTASEIGVYSCPEVFNQYCSDHSNPIVQMRFTEDKHLECALPSKNGCTILDYTTKCIVGAIEFEHDMTFVSACPGHQVSNFVTCDKSCWTVYDWRGEKLASVESFLTDPEEQIDEGLFFGRTSDKIVALVDGILYVRPFSCDCWQELDLGLEFGKKLYGKLSPDAQTLILLRFQRISTKAIWFKKMFDRLLNSKSLTPQEGFTTLVDISSGKQLGSVNGNSGQISDDNSTLAVLTGQSIAIYDLPLRRPLLPAFGAALAAGLLTYYLLGRLVRSR